MVSEVFFKKIIITEFKISHVVLDPQTDRHLFKVFQEVEYVEIPTSEFGYLPINSTYYEKNWNLRPKKTFFYIKNNTSTYLMKRGRSKETNNNGSKGILVWDSHHLSVSLTSDHKTVPKNSYPVPSQPQHMKRECGARKFRNHSKRNTYPYKPFHCFEQFRNKLHSMPSYLDSI